MVLDSQVRSIVQGIHYLANHEQEHRNALELRHEPTCIIIHDPLPYFSRQVWVAQTHIPMLKRGRGSLVIKVMDSWLDCHEFEPSTTEDPPDRGSMHIKSVESSNVLPLVWCGS
ncbi:hypothetical protein TNCV_2327121 [Trichonephila clavipes]|nr:hypothetical protein TNCV_2327121 [Trichonephila clavipes]